MTRDEINAASSLEAARFYQGLNLKLVPVPVGEKGPTDEKWPTIDYELKEFVDECNIGIKLGLEVDKNAFVFDIDVDLKLDDGRTIFPGAAQLVAELLPSIGWVFGRQSAARSHFMGLATAPFSTVKYLGVKKRGLIELRGLAKKKQTPQITIVPPGQYKKTERRTFDELDMVRFAHVHDGPMIEHLVKCAAIGLALLQVWPNKGLRHDARLAFSKVLHEVGLSDAHAIAILTAVNRVTGSQWQDVSKTFQDTITKDPKDTIGASWVIDHVTDGQELLTAIDRILGRKARAPEGSFDVTEVDLKTITPAVWSRIAKTNNPVRHCLQGGVPVRIVQLPDTDNEDQRRPTWVFQILERDRLRNEVAQVTEFVKLVGKNYKQIAPPGDIISDMLATTPKHIPLPVVNRIIYAPIMAPDGTISLDAGYQPATGTFYVPDPRLTIPPVPESPSDDDVAMAVGTLYEPLQDFKFESETDRAHAIGLLLLPFVRSLIDGPTPLHLIKKSIAGEGATLLTDTLLYPAVGSDIAKMGTVDDNDEWRKTITATLLDGPQAVVIDNARELVSPVLAKALTDSIWKERILGVSRVAILPVQCVWVATGINPVLHTELTRRIVPITLNSGTDRPWERTGFVISDLRGWSRDNRGEMIWAALTLARSWHVAGRPKGEKSLGMFEGWANVIGGILKVAGFEKFLGNLTDMYDASDVEGDAIRWFYEEWNAQHQNKAVKISEVSVWATRDDSPVLGLLSSKSQRGLQTEFSRWVRSLTKRVVSVDDQSVRIEPVKVANRSSSCTWKLATLNAAPLPAAGPPDVELPF